LVLFGVPVLLALAPALVAVAPPPEDKSRPLPQVKDFSLLDPKGGRHTPQEWRERKAVVLVFLGTECPVSNGYAPLMSRLARGCQAKGVAFYGVHPDPDVTAEVAAKHAAEYQLTFTLLLDPRQVLASQTGVTRVPEAVVLSPAGQVLYRGRIDDRYSQNGQRRDEPRTRDLEAAVEAVLAGRKPDPATTEVFGCPLPPPAASDK
jgi:peroxiredoxin